MGCDVVVLEDDEDLRAVLVWSLEREGLSVLAMGEPEAALSVVKQADPGLFVLDLMIDGSDAGDLVHKLRAEKIGSRTPIVLISGSSDLKRQAARLGATAALTKPFAMKDLLRIVKPLCRCAPPATESLELAYAV